MIFMKDYLKYIFILEIFENFIVQNNYNKMMKYLE